MCKAAPTAAATVMRVSEGAKALRVTNQYNLKSKSPRIPKEFFPSFQNEARRFLEKSPVNVHGFPKKSFIQPFNTQPRDFRKDPRRILEPDAAFAKFVSQHEVGIQVSILYVPDARRQMRCGSYTDARFAHAPDNAGQAGCFGEFSGSSFLR